MTSQLGEMICISKSLSSPYISLSLADIALIGVDDQDYYERAVIEISRLCQVCPRCFSHNNIIMRPHAVD